MTDMLLDISGKIDEPTVLALSFVKAATDKLSVPFFIELYPERGRDAADILEIMDLYEYAYGPDRLYSSEQELMIEERFDSKMATIRLLGRDMARVAGSPTGRLILSILICKLKQGFKDGVQGAES